jgi:hypothetical protein
MLASSIPTKMPVIFGASAVSGTIRTVPVTSTGQSGSASFTGGFPPETQLPEGAGGTPPFGQDFNGLFNTVTAWLQWIQAGGAVPPYDATFSTSLTVPGYPNGALIASAVTTGQYWVSTVDNNTTNPDTGGAGWSGFSILGGVASTGQIMVRPTNETSSANPPTNPGTSSSNVIGWVRANGNTIGNTASGATELASTSLAANLYSWHWTNFSNTQCPVTGGRGASAAADFAAGKPIKLLDFRGYSGVFGNDTMGATAGAAGNFAGVTFLTGNQNTAGSTFGANAVTLTVAQLPTLTSTGNATNFQVDGSANNFTYLSASGGTLGFASGTYILRNGTQASAGVSVATLGTSGSSHQNTPLGIVGNVYLKL